METSSVNAPGYHSRFRIEVKMTAEEKELIVRAASVSRAGMSEFVRDAALAAARRLLKDDTNG